MAKPSLYMQVPHGSLYDKRITQVDDDDRSTAVPSDVLDGTVSELSSWDTGNIEDLGSCGVLTSAELRAARLQKLARASGAAKPSSKASGKAALAKSPQHLKPATPALRKAEASAPKPTPTQQHGGYPGSMCQSDDDQSTAAPSDVVDASIIEESSEALSSAQLRAARLQRSAQASEKCQQPKAKAVVSPKAAGLKPAPVKAKAAAAPPESTSRSRLNAGTQLNAELNKSSREAIRDMGLWEYMPARNPVVTRDTAKGADWHIGFDEYKHSLGGVPDASPVERPQKADNLMRSLDVQSREALKEMGLWEHMPAKNPVVTRESVKGADWHIGFRECEHSLGGVPDSKPVERPHKADALHRQLDVHSKEQLKEMGLWEHMPARNPVVTKQSNKGADWHVCFGQYVHTLGGVPDS